MPLKVAGAMAELTHVESHFRFGENWAAFAEEIDLPRIEQAQHDLARLVGGDNLHGMTFLDIGSGSGLHSLAATRLGADVSAIDIDADSVATTRALLTRCAPGNRWTAELRSIFDLKPETFGRFDIVYSWGVLHHTGAMYDAIGSAAALVNDRGRLCIALYGRTAFCGFWRLEKRLYSTAPKQIQQVAQSLYVGAWWCVQSLRGFFTGRKFSLSRYLQDYARKRGMSFYTDVHDWLGGYPYESIAPDELRRFMTDLGFVEERAFIQPGARHGLFGAGCDEYVFRRADS